MLKNKEFSFSKELEIMHLFLKEHHDSIDRISVALYDKDTDYLKTYSFSSDQVNPLSHYQFKLSKSESLSKIVKTLQPRLIDNIHLIPENGRQHTEAIFKTNYQSSYTVPMMFRKEFYGFVFFNSSEENTFTEKVQKNLKMVAHLITLIISQDSLAHRLLHATLRSVLEVAGKRDFETGQHIERVAHYTRLIAQSTADDFDWDDEDIELVFQFAPLHDIGKLAIPDSILLKEGILTDEEYEYMKQHVKEGYRLITRLMKYHGLQSIRGVEKLENIVLYHHEKMDGTGYLSGIKGDSILLESRMVTVADIFDALTSARPYKKAWSNEAAFAELSKLAEEDKLDPILVQALIEQKEAIAEIQSIFKEDPIS